MEEQNKLSRRGLLQAAGGITFLAISPWEEMLAIPGDRPSRAPGLAPARPVFTALPYLQPGPGGSRLVDGSESIVVAWQTDPVPAKFTLTYGAGGFDQEADLGVSHRGEGYEYVKDRRINYVARLTGLSLGKRYQYRVTMDGARVVEGYFTTRKPRGRRVRFVAFGDNSHGDMADRAIAYQAYQARPDFVMNTGDNVYEEGCDGEYSRFFFPIYNADQLGSRVGAPLLRSVPFYTVLGNHDINSRDAKGHPIADFDRYEDGLGYYTNLHLPLNGPVPNYPTPVVGQEARLREFRGVAGGRYPNMSNYSFDYGDGHFLCLDSNMYVDPTDRGLQAWISADLESTDAAWKIVVFHHPPYNVGNKHYDEQHMRVLSPLFERHGVHLAFHGHEHNYQRTRPLKFVARDDTGARDVGNGTRYVPGTFTVDRGFDGKENCRPDGIIYITTGAGGKSLYDPEMNEAPGSWLHKEDSDADYVARMITDRHSLTICEMDARQFSLRQVDEWGQEIDRIRVVK